MPPVKASAKSARPDSSMYRQRSAVCSASAARDPSSASMDAPASEALPMLCSLPAGSWGSIPMAAALAGSRYTPKPPARYTPSSSASVMPCCASSTCTPAATAAFASCSDRTSPAVRYTLSVR